MSRHDDRASLGRDDLADLDLTAVHAADADLRRRIASDRAIRPACGCATALVVRDDDEDRCALCGRRRP